MAKIGIARIKGNSVPKVGETNYYEIEKYYTGTPPLKSYNDIKWKLYAQEGNGWRELKGTLKYGKKVPFNFPQKWYGKKLLIEAYINAPEKKAPPGLIVSPVMGKRKINQINFLDSNYRKFTTPPKYGQQVIVRINTVNMLGETLNLSLWERDTVSNKGHDASENENIWGAKRKIVVENKSGFVDYKFTLDPSWAIKANKNIFEGSEHEYYILVEANGINPTYSYQQQVKDEVYKQEKIQAKGIGSNPLSLGKSPQVVESSSNEQNNTTNECPNCKKDITLDEIKKICVDSKGNCLIEDDTMIKSALPYLNKYKEKVGINTCTRKAHFLAQLSHESKFYQLQEKFKYSNPEKMRTLFYSYFKQFGALENQRIEAKRLSDLSYNKSNWPEVANAIYGPTHPVGKRAEHGKTDGWRYSGKGFKQITWKNNYKDLQKYVNKNFGLNVNWIEGNNPYKLKNNPMDAIVSALAYWGFNNISFLADGKTDNDVEKVTKLINTYTDGLDERIRYFNKAIKVLKVNECNPCVVNGLNEKGTVVIVSGISTKYGKEKNSSKSWPIYETKVFRNISIKTFKKLNKENKLPKADYTTYLTRDAHGNFKGRSGKRYGSGNECPPGEYFLNKGNSSQKYDIYLADKQGVGESGILGSHGWRGGIAIHGGWPSGTVGCLSTHCSNYGNKQKKQLINSRVATFIENIPDFEDNNDDRPVKIIIEERKATKKGNLWYGEIE